MAKVDAEQQSSRRKQNRFLVMLLAGAALVSGAKDLGQLQELTSGLFGLGSSLHQTVRAATSPAEPVSPRTLAQNDNSVQPFYWNGRVAPDQLIEIGGIDVGRVVGGELDTAAVKQAGRSDSGSVNNNQVAQARVVTICARSAQRDSQTPNTRLPVSHRLQSQSATIDGHQNKVRFDFAVRVPAGVEVVTRASNEDRKAACLSSNRPSIRLVPVLIPRVDSPATGRISIGPIGYSQAKTHLRTLCPEIRAMLAEALRTEAIQFKTSDGTTTLNLLRILKARIKAEKLNGTATSEFPLSFPEMIQRALSEAAAAEETH